MEPVATMHAALVDIDTLVVGVAGNMDTVESVLLCVGIVFGQVG